ncbi:MAG: hypothetical protein AAFQ82_00940, partial [Myxococcota bacterium]
ADPGGDERDFDDDLTGVQQALPPVPKKPATGTSAGALLSAGGAALKELGAVVGRQPLPLKVAGGLAVFTMLLLVALIASGMGPSGPEERWTEFRVTLRTGPGAGDGYSRIDYLPRGSTVTAFESSANFTLIRDAYGRAGYVANESLVDSPPVPRPDEPFADCRQSPLEEKLDACQERARGQLERCESACDDSAKPCVDGCATQFTDCMAGCDTRLVVVEEAPKVAEAESPTVAEAPAEALETDAAEEDGSDETAEPGEESDGTEDETVEDADSAPGEVSEAPATPKKKKRGKKKRRRRKRR